MEKKSATWINQWNPGWTKKMYYSWLEKLFIQMTPKQRSILGIPPPGDKYWTKSTIEILNQDIQLLILVLINQTYNLFAILIILIIYY